MYSYLFNPKANRGRGKKFENKIRRYLKELNISKDFIKLNKKGDAAKATKNAIKNKVKKIVAIGGDGIINDIIQVIAKKDIAMGIIPIGEMNILAGILGIENWQKGCEALNKGKIIDMDLGMVDDRYFTSSIEIENPKGEEEKILGIFPTKKPKKYYPISLNIINDNSELKLQTNISSVLISTIPLNNHHAYKLERKLTDGKLHILIISRPAAQLELKQKNSTNKKQKRNDEITILEGDSINIKSKNPIQVKADGEMCGKTPVNISVVPHCLKIIVPEKENTKDI